MHEVLATNAKRRGNEARARTPAPLRGLMRCTHCSSAMTPTHTRRRGRLYRYYVCLGASRRGHDTCPVRSIAASEVEGLVLGQVRRLLASPELVARTITAVRRENGAAEDTELEEGEVIEALGALEPVWDELYPAEQARILRLLIERIDVAPDGISVTLHAAGIRSLVAELADQERSCPGRFRTLAGGRRVMTERAGLEVETLTIRIPIRLQRRGGRKLIMTPEGVAAPARKPSRDETLIKALVRAHRWRRQDRERAGEVDHRPCGAGGRHRRLRLPAPAAHLPGAGHRRGDPRRAAAEGAEAGRDAGERAAGLERPEADLGLQQLTRTCSERFDCGAAKSALKLKQTAGKRKSEPACPVCARKQPCRRVPWTKGFSQQATLFQR